MAENQQLEDSILDHLHQIAFCKKALLQVAVDIANDFPAQSSVMLRVIKSMTSSADKLLGDTVTTEIPKENDP